MSVLKALAIRRWLLILILYNLKLIDITSFNLLVSYLKRSSWLQLILLYPHWRRSLSLVSHQLLLPILALAICYPFLVVRMSRGVISSLIMLH